MTHVEAFMQGDAETLAVWKSPPPLRVEDFQRLDTPRGAVPLSVVVQRGQPVLYCLVDPYEPLRDSMPILTAGTGHDRSDLDASRFIGTYLMRDGALVFHVFRGEG